MIIKGRARAAPGQMASYIEKPGKNELVQVHEVRGAMATDPRGAIQEMAAIASASRCKSFLYHAQINPKADEHLTPEQWQKAVDTLEKNLRLDGHQRIVFEHIKEGRQHYHVVWNRVDVESLRAVHMSNSYAIHERTARELEREFNLERVQGVHAEREPETKRPARTPQQWEIERGQKSGLDPRQIREEITGLWKSNSTGKDFAAALEQRGYILAKGDRRDFCIVDRAGDDHSLARRIEGAKAADVREKMKDIDRAGLPTIKEAKALQLENRRQGIETEKRQPERAEPYQEKTLTEPKRIDTRDFSIFDLAGDDHSLARHIEGAKAADVREKMKDIDRAEPYQGKAQAAAKQMDARDDSKGVRLMVSGVGGAAEKLTRFVEEIIDFFAPPRAITYDEFLKNTESRREYYQQKDQEAKRDEALQNMRNDMKAGRNLSPSDVRNLNRQDIEQIKHFGDDGIRQIIEQHERERLQRDREKEIGRQRER